MVVVVLLEQKILNLALLAQECELDPRFKAIPQGIAVAIENMIDNYEKEKHLMSLHPRQAEALHRVATRRRIKNPRHLTTLELMGLITTANGKPQLTPEGEKAWNEWKQNK